MTKLNVALNNLTLLQNLETKENKTYTVPTALNFNLIHIHVVR